MCTSREEITEKYLLMALEELSKHRGSIKKGRSIDKMWHKEMLYYETIGKNKADKPVIKLRKKGE